MNPVKDQQRRYKAPYAGEGLPSIEKRIMKKLF